MISGNLPAAFQSKSPLSTTAPPMEVPWPPIILVSEYTAMSAPCSNGLKSGGGVTVLSTIRGSPCLWATSAMASRSSTLPLGLPMDSV